MRCLTVAALLAPVLATVAGRPAGAQRHGGGGIPCGRSYISADKVCHVGVPDTPTPTAPGGDAAGAPLSAAGAAPAPTAGAQRTATAKMWLRSLPYAGADELAEISRGAIVQMHDCVQNGAWCSVTYGTGVGFVPGGLLSEHLDNRDTLPAPAGAYAAPVRLDARGVHDERRVAAVPLELRGGPSDRAAVTFTVPPRAVLAVHSCAVSEGAWCVASSRGHTGFFPSASLPTETATPADEYDERVSSYARPRTARAPRRAYGARSAVGATGGGHAGYYTGPRGGCYTYSASGRKRYVDHSYCR